MLERAGHNPGLLGGHELFATAPAGRLLHEQLEPPVRCFRGGRAAAISRSAPRIAGGEISLLVFF
jgi:methylglyoxal synthase